MSVVDSHAHVWPASNLPVFQADTVAERNPQLPVLERYLASASVSRAVLVQPTALGRDHSYLLECITSSPEHFAGIGFLDPDWPDYDEYATRLHQQGLAGFRLVAIQQPGFFRRPEIPNVISHLDDKGIPISLLMLPEQLPDLADLLERRRLKGRIVIDHMARLTIGRFPMEQALEALVALAKHETISVKVSALAALSCEPPPYHDLHPAVHRLIDAFGSERIVWGTDFPYVDGVAGYSNALKSMRLILQSFPIADQRRILEHNALAIWWSDLEPRQIKKDIP